MAPRRVNLDLLLVKPSLCNLGQIFGLKAFRVVTTSIWVR